LPELFGAEQEIEALIQAGQGSYELPSIERSGSGREAGHAHFDLALTATGNPGEPLLLVLEDHTRHLEMQRQLLQNWNEILLLKKELEEKNAALAAMSEAIRQHNHELERQVRLRTKELRDSRLEIVRRLGIAAEYRDGHKGRHIFRISRSCALIAQRYGLDESVCELLLHATAMHDVGKIAIADSILLKPGKLDSVEWSIIRSCRSPGKSPTAITNGGTEAATPGAWTEGRSPYMPGSAPSPMSTTPSLPTVPIRWPEARRTRWKRSGGTRAPSSIPGWWTPSCRCWATSSS
jgi:hypothetical protein